MANPNPEHELLFNELDAIYNQANARLGVIAFTQNTSVVLAGALAAAFATLGAADRAVPLTWYLVFPVPFFLLGFMLLREDLILVAGDERFYEIRNRILQPLPIKESHGLLRFPPAIKGDVLVPSYQRLTSLRYLVTMLVPIVLLLAFVFQTRIAFTTIGCINGTLLGINLIVLVILFRGLRRLSAQSDRVDSIHARIVAS